MKNKQTNETPQKSKPNPKPNTIKPSFLKPGLVTLRHVWALVLKLILGVLPRCVFSLLWLEPAWRLHEFKEEMETCSSVEEGAAKGH